MFPEGWKQGIPHQYVHWILARPEKLTSTCLSRPMRVLLAQEASPSLRGIKDTAQSHLLNLHCTSQAP